MKHLIIIVIGILLLLPFISTAQMCHVQTAPDSKYSATNKYANFEVNWYPEWLEYTNGEKRFPGPLPLLEKWDHPYMKHGYTSAMHEGPYASDVSNLPGPLMENVEVQYFHSLQKGGGFSGMCPSYAFIDDTTMLTFSFGRANTTLLLLDIRDTMTIIDFVEIPGRGNSALELAGKKGRAKIFSNTAGGAYFYLSGKDNVYIPGANNNILRITIKDRKFDKQNVRSINLKDQIEAGNAVDESLSKKDQLNLLTALIPDAQGNVWFTSRQGVIGLIHRTDRTADSCPKVYATFIGMFAIVEKIKRYWDEEFDSMQELDFMNDMEQITPEFRKEFRDHFMIDKDTREEIQNSFSVGKDGVYIVSNFALYKFRFNEETKKIELDPKWEETFKEGDLLYDNDWSNKPGQLNTGSGTTPTLMGDDYVAICDNDTNQVNLCIYYQQSGKLVSKLKLFDDRGAAVENSAVAYDGSFVVCNTYGYEDPFKVNDTPGGIMRFDLNENTGGFEKVENWPASGQFDCKTATPKLSAPNGMMYVYDRSDTAVNGHHDWQVTAIDFKTGNRVFYIRSWFEKRGFKDNIGRILKAGSLGNKNYDRKVLNNLWGTFTIGPDNSFYIGAYRGFIRVSSDPQ